MNKTSVHCRVKILNKHYVIYYYLVEGRLTWAPLQILLFMTCFINIERFLRLTGLGIEFIRSMFLIKYSQWNFEMRKNNNKVLVR